MANETNSGGSSGYWPIGVLILLAAVGYNQWQEKTDAPSPGALEALPRPVALPKTPSASAAVSGSGSVPTPSPRWLRVAAMDNGTVWYLDTKSVRGPRDKRAVWVKADHSLASSVPHRKTMELYSVDCNTTGYRSLSIVQYSKDGKVVGEQDFQNPPQLYAPPESNISNVVDRACDRRFDSD